MTVCSWCSTEVAEGTTECPTCGANLVPDGDPNVPGVTAVDAASILRSKAAPQSRNRLLSWISGEYTTDLPSKAEAQAIAPPALEVRREILRLELEAEVANLQAEADALRAEAAAEGRTIELPPEPQAAAPEATAPEAAAPEATAPEAAAPEAMDASDSATAAPDAATEAPDAATEAPDAATEAEAAATEAAASEDQTGS